MSCGREFYGRVERGGATLGADDRTRLAAALELSLSELDRAIAGTATVGAVLAATRPCRGGR